LCLGAARIQNRIDQSKFNPSAGLTPENSL
jgi:hypothetical protein